MSNEAINWVKSIRDKELKGNRRLTLLLLADHHNGETGECFPGVELLCDESGGGRSTVIGALKWLDGRYIEKERRHRLNGSRTSNGYALLGLGPEAGHCPEPADTPRSSFPLHQVQNPDAPSPKAGPPEPEVKPEVQPEAAAAAFSEGPERHRPDDGRSSLVGKPTPAPSGDDNSDDGVEYVSPEQFRALKLKLKKVPT